MTPYIIAEIGINHEGNLQRAIKLIKKAKKAGADAVKFQLFNPNTLEWISGNLLEERYNHNLIEYKGILYVIGGRQSDGTILRSVEKYLNGKWEFSANMSEKRYNAKTIIFNKLIYIVGGIGDSNNIVNNIEYFDGIIWRTIVPISLIALPNFFINKNKDKFHQIIFWLFSVILGRFTTLWAPPIVI